ncbi:hypothetical protein [Bacillus horti]|uniref:Uncharacterized protein n=1 Tax=Caldalkalibacillus horti TaxID=77523 RepID=A0ABT9VT53_9BACI|nr:hypothetical protein [Bacillus horti]MDQ0164163.1 hypothetical protein [Bacillus horti]
MIKKVILFTLGLILAVSSIPHSIKMILETIQTSQMQKSFTINILEAPSSSFTFGNVNLSIYHTNEGSLSYDGPFDQSFGTADIHLEINEETMDILQDYPYILDVEGLQQYAENIVFLTVDELKSSSKTLVVLLNTTREIIEELPSLDIVGYAADEELQYRMYTISEEGSVTQEDFSFLDRSAFQTALLNEGGLTHYKVGYYTNALSAYPNFVYPWIYPLLISIIGVILFITQFPIRVGKTTK